MGNSFPLATVQYCHRLTSDHVLLKLNTGVFDKRQRRPFRFEKMWLKADDVDETIANSWSILIEARDAARNIT